MVLAVGVGGGGGCGGGGGGLWDGRDGEVGVAFHSFLFFQSQRNIYFLISDIYCVSIYKQQERMISDTTL